MLCDFFSFLSRMFKANNLYCITYALRLKVWQSDFKTLKVISVNPLSANPTK